MKTQLILSQATANVVHDKRNVKKDGTYPLKLRVIYERIVKDYSVGISLTEEDFNILSTARIREERLRNYKHLISDIERRASEIIDKLHGHFSFALFKSHFFEDRIKGDPGNVYKHFEDYIDLLKRNGQVTTSVGYNTTLNSLKTFKRQLRFEEVDSEFLHSYDRFMKNKSSSDTTISMYIRNLRTIYNQVLDKGLISSKLYPFSKNRYQIPGSRNRKKALTMKELMSIYSYETSDGSAEDRAKDIWIFSYLCNGINMKDVCRLKFSNITGDKITIIRAKTERTARGNQQAIEIFPDSRAFEIIKKWGNLKRSQSDFVFPFLPENPSPEVERACVQNLTKTVNKYMKRLGKSLNLNLPLTTYVARHTFSTVLKRSNKVSVEQISELLGHKSIKTTSYYLDSFEDDSKRGISQLLTDFSIVKNVDKLVPIE